jgi:hypothetical protein
MKHCSLRLSITSSYYTKAYLLDDGLGALQNLLRRLNSEFPSSLRSGRIQSLRISRQKFAVRGPLGLINTLCESNDLRADIAKDNTLLPNYEQTKYAVGIYVCLDNASDKDDQIALAFGLFIYRNYLSRLVPSIAEAEGAAISSPAVQPLCYTCDDQLRTCTNNGKRICKSCGDTAGLH